MVQAETSGKTCFDIGEALPVDAERTTATNETCVSSLQTFFTACKIPSALAPGIFYYM
jgi:hypothetical protein